jgi:hypothetical protein
VPSNPDKAIWIICPIDPKGPLSDKVYPIVGSAKVVTYFETATCPMCGGEDHRLMNCLWITEDKVDTWWGKNSYDSPSKKDKKQVKTNDTIDTPPVPAPTIAIDVVADVVDNTTEPSWTTRMTSKLIKWC